MGDGAAIAVGKIQPWQGVKLAEVSKRASSMRQIGGGYDRILPRGRPVALGDEAANQQADAGPRTPQSSPCSHLPALRASHKRLLLCPSYWNPAPFAEEHSTASPTRRPSRRSGIRIDSLYFVRPLASAVRRKHRPRVPPLASVRQARCQQPRQTAPASPSPVRRTASRRRGRTSGRSRC